MKIRGQRKLLKISKHKTGQKDEAENEQVSANVEKNNGNSNKKET